MRYFRLMAYYMAKNSMTARQLRRYQKALEQVGYVED